MTERSERNNCLAATGVTRVAAADGGKRPAAAVPVGGAADSDGDGTPDAKDCAPADATVGQGAPDRPDLAFRDTNCDGIDGTAANAIFVSPDGSDGGSGTPDTPKRTLAAAIAAAAAAGLAEVYAAAGSYGERLVVSNGVSVFGGFTAGWLRPALRPTSVTNATAIDGRIEGAVATGIGAPTSLQLLSISAAGTTTPGTSVYGMRLAASPAIMLQGVTITAGSTGNGIAGATPSGIATAGGPGALGDPGVESSPALGCGNGAQPQGGAGGSSPAGRPGGKGGNAGRAAATGEDGLQALPGGGVGGTGVPSQAGAWVSADYLGKDGASGAAGSVGSAGAPVFGETYGPTDGAAGTAGDPGFGGGGGGGGGGGTNQCDSYGGAGGGGGGGGGAGEAGAGGDSAGGSFALYLWASNANVVASTLAAGDGGAGGAGGTGQDGGAGGAPGAVAPGSLGGSLYGGPSGQDDGSIGARGGAGGPGGTGGAGGGGAGGPSVAVVAAGGSIPLIAGTSLTVGVAGSGGNSMGNAGPPGPRENVLTTP